MGLLGKIFGGEKRNKKLAQWAKSVPISSIQQNAMWEVWLAGKQKNPPAHDPLLELNEDDRKYIIKICSADFRPLEYGTASVLRLSSFKHYQEIGFTAEQAAVITGMMFNMVGRKDLQ